MFLVNVFYWYYDVMLVVTAGNCSFSVIYGWFNFWNALGVEAEVGIWLSVGVTRFGKVADCYIFGLYSWSSILMLLKFICVPWTLLKNYGDVNNAESPPAAPAEPAAPPLDNESWKENKELEYWPFELIPGLPKVGLKL